ncbi:MAG: restriction endonuclease [Candidatus Competibacter sp.]
MQESSLNSALRQFEIVEANLSKAEKILTEIENNIPSGIVFGENPNYEMNCQNFVDLLASLPNIDGWKPEMYLMALDEIAQNRLDAQEVGEIECIAAVERLIFEPSRLLRKYRYLFNKKRKELVRDSLEETINLVDKNLSALGLHLNTSTESNKAIEDKEFDVLKENIDKISMLIGNVIAKPNRWSDLYRHISYRMPHDLRDIIRFDWPTVRDGLYKAMYDEKEPIPVEVEDLGNLVRSNPRGSVAIRLKWEILTDEDFERLIFEIISSCKKEYENLSWLMKTNAPDRGRDLSVDRVHCDPLTGTLRQRVIIQCKNWNTKSISPNEISNLKELLKLWEPPRVDVCIIATSGRFTSDAVLLIEKINFSDNALRIEMWPESHLERLLADRPSLIADFRLR